MYIFISYGHDGYADLPKNMRARFEEMTKNGEGDFEVFLDDRIELGSEWEYEIEQALEKTDYMLLFVSEHSRRPDSFCRNEISYLKEVNKLRKKNKEQEIRVIPVRLDESIPPISVVVHQSVMWMEENKEAVFDEKFNKILHALGAAPKGEPEPVKTPHEIIWGYITKGDFARTDRKMKEAIDAYYKAHDIAKREVDRNENEDTLHDYGAVSDRLGTAYKISDNYSTAKKYYENCVTIANKIINIESSYLSYRDLSVSLEKMGDIALKEDDVQKAKEYYEESLEIRRENASKYPSYESNRDLSVSLNKMGDIALKEDDVQKAKEYYEEALKKDRENASKYPSYESSSDLSVSFNKMGDISFKENDMVKAKEWYSKSLKIDKENHEKYPSYRSLIDVSFEFLNIQKPKKHCQIMRKLLICSIMRFAMRQRL